MSQPVRLFFDECMPPRLVKDFREFFHLNRPKPEFRHLRENFQPGTADPAWLREIDGEQWIVVTGDKASKSSLNPLPAICKSCGVTHLVVKPAIRSAGYEKIKESLVAVWADLQLLYRVERGTQVTLGRLDEKGGRTTYRLRIKGKSITGFLVD